MPAYAVLGGQWGDEGKGKIIDYLANDVRPLNSRVRSKNPRPADIVVRFNGGNNAGHTIHNSLGEFKLHLIPAGIFNPTTLNVIGPGVVVDPTSFQEEFSAIHEQSSLSDQDFLSRLRISKKAHLVFPWHILEDELQEKHRGGTAIGTTGRGIGPVFTDKTARFGLRVGDLMNEMEFRRKFYDLRRRKFSLLEFHGAPSSKASEAIGDAEGIIKRMFEFRDKFADCFSDVELMLQNADSRGEHILFEGAQGFLLDVEHGTYPFVTSSRVGISAAYNCGITKFREVLGVVKAYTTRVGEGPFPTEMDEVDAGPFRDMAKEFGATTGRPRRIGWLDIPALKYFARMNGVTSLALTKLDILDNLRSIGVGIGYRCSEHREGCSSFECVISGSATGKSLAVHKGWGPEGLPNKSGSVAGKESMEDFPKSAMDYCNFIQDEVAPIALVSTGPHRDETIVV